MEKFNKVMMTLYWAVFAMISVAAALYCTVEKARCWINRHVVIPYVHGSSKFAEELADMYYEEETKSEEE